MALERFGTSRLAAAEPILREVMATLDPADAQLLMVADGDGTVLWTVGGPAALDAAERTRILPGTSWSESACGTNGPGTALVERHPIQVFSFEHLMPGAEGWVCSAAPIRDPETGDQIGVVNLAGEFRVAHPLSLAVMASAARSIEYALAHRVQMERAQLRDRWAGHLRRGGPVALACESGTIIDADPDGWLGLRIPQLASSDSVVVLGRERLDVEPVEGGYFLWRSDERRTRRAAPVEEHLRIEALGRDRATVEVDGRRVELSRRHSEMLVLMTMFPDGLTDEQVALRVYGESGRPVTARAELSRLRRILGDHVSSTPYRLLTTVSADFLRLERLVREGSLEEALARYPGLLLPRTDAPAIVELRERLDHALRGAVLDANVPDLLVRWLDLPAGEDDIEACRALVRLLALGDPRRAGALSRLRRISQG